MLFVQNFYLMMIICKIKEAMMAKAKDKETDSSELDH